MNSTFNWKAHKEQLNAFPDITFEEYNKIPDLQVKTDIGKKNKIVLTDTYNRTMTNVKGEERIGKMETYTMTFRKSPNGVYNIVDGVRTELKKIFSGRITQRELDFAADFYENEAKVKKGNGYFNKAMWQKVIDEYDGYLPIDISAVKDGTMLRPGEMNMVVRGPSEFAAIYEPLLMRIYLQSVVATDMHEIDQIIQGRSVEFTNDAPGTSNRIVEMGNRSAINHEHHLAAVEACYVGSQGNMNRSSNDLAALVYSQIKASGTTAHRFYASYDTEEDAMEATIQSEDTCSLLVDLNDSYSGIEKIIRLKKKYRNTGKRIAMRLDSGDIADQAVYALRRLKEEGMCDPDMDKIVASDISTIEGIRKVENDVTAAGFNPKDFIMYGLGGLLVAKEKTRDKLSVGYKVTETEEGAVMKCSNDELKESVPGTPNIEIREDGRWIVQESEPVLGERLLSQVVKQGQVLYDEDDFAAVEDAVRQVGISEKLIKLPMMRSETTRRLRDALKAKSQRGMIKKKELPPITA